MKSESSELAPDVVAMLAARGWPGNVRELRATLASVRNLFGAKGIRPEHIRAAHDFETLAVGGNQNSIPLDHISAHRLHCLRHLQQVDDVLNAAQRAMDVAPQGVDSLSPSSSASIATVIEMRIHELDALRTRRILFHSAATYSAVQRIAENLRRFIELLATNAEHAPNFWREILTPQFTSALAALFDEVEKLERQP